MAQILASSNISIMSIRAFLGINQNDDGDTKIKTGELADMRNFKITRDKHLQIRPGTKTLFLLREAWDLWAQSNTPSTDTPVFCGAWEGLVGGGSHLIAAFGGVVFDIDKTLWSAQAIGTATQDKTSFFGFDEKVYLLNGHE